MNDDFECKELGKSIDKLMLDVEGAEYEILKSINYDNILIKNIIFEKKHFDGPFKEGNKLNEIKHLLTKKNYNLIDLDDLEKTPPPIEISFLL